MVLRVRSLVIFAFGALSVVAWACASTPDNKTPADETKAPEGPKLVQHEKCDESMGRVEALDQDHTGKPSLKQIFDKTTNRELCRVADLNHDGKPDMYEYYNADGTLRRREGMYETGDGVSEVLLFEGGKLVHRERDTTGQRKIDTWDTYDPSTGKLTKRERDNNGDGKVDQWWTYDNDKITIAIDKNGTGHPDPNETITVGMNGQPIASATANANSADAGPIVPEAKPIPPPVIMPQSSTMIDAGVPAKKKGGVPKK